MENNNYHKPDGSGSGFAIAGMVLGIISVVFACCIPYITIFTAIIGVILSALSLYQKKPGRGMAIAGLVTSIIGLVPAILVIVGLISGAASL